MDQQPTTPPPTSPSAAGLSGSAGKPKAVQKIGKIVVDRELCIGAASCIALAANTFELDSENKAVVKNPKGDSAEDIRAAAVSCPTNAIFLYDEEGNQIHPAPQPNRDRVKRDNEVVLRGEAEKITRL